MQKETFPWAGAIISAASLKPEELDVLFTALPQHSSFFSYNPHISFSLFKKLYLADKSLSRAKALLESRVLEKEHFDFVLKECKDFRKGVLVSLLNSSPELFSEQVAYLSSQKLTQQSADMLLASYLKKLTPWDKKTEFNLLSRASYKVAALYAVSKHLSFTDDELVRIFTIPFPGESRHSWPLLTGFFIDRPNVAKGIVLHFMTQLEVPFPKVSFATLENIARAGILKEQEKLVLLLHHFLKTDQLKSAAYSALKVFYALPTTSFKTRVLIDSFSNDIFATLDFKSELLSSSQLVCNNASSKVVDPAKCSLALVKKLLCWCETSSEYHAIRTAKAFTMAKLCLNNNLGDSESKRLKLLFENKKLSSLLGNCHAFALVALDSKTSATKNRVLCPEKTWQLPTTAGARKNTFFSPSKAYFPNISTYLVKSTASQAAFYKLSVAAFASEEFGNNLLAWENFISLADSFDGAFSDLSTLAKILSQ